MPDPIEHFHSTRPLETVDQQGLREAMDSYYHALETDQGLDEAYNHYLCVSGGNQEALDEYVYSKWLRQTSRQEDDKAASPTDGRKDAAPDRSEKAPQKDVKMSDGGDDGGGGGGRGGGNGGGSAQAPGDNIPPSPPSPLPEGAASETQRDTNGHNQQNTSAASARSTNEGTAGVTAPSSSRAERVLVLGAELAWEVARMKPRPEAVFQVADRLGHAGMLKHPRELGERLARDYETIAVAEALLAKLRK
ncbi:uncharacterized protein LOC62_04G005849 [Vanrija pseudolonga]|uniref:Uncharacterized protein n=1 Tax=Vanrija pseudolonga TaxID=143232 RepID=A0AAF0Y930_9TREE|nr:hypothetical protein LOC62_04G005849 [Vanrija pseudolonga]